MVLNYYQLAEQPFGVTPDPRFLFSSATHREAIASVLYGVKAGRGFTALIAEPGMGKTTVLFNLLQQLGGTAKTAFLFQAQDSPRNFLRNLLLDLGVEDDGQDLVRMHVKLNECLVRETGQGKHFVVMVDEAQNLDEPVLEVVRMLSNFETAREKLMHIILAGQPELAQKLASPQLIQLRQRISIVARLQPFNVDETKAYVAHRLHVAGYREKIPLFSDHAFALIAQHSGGIPRNINNICFNAMSLGCAMKRRTIPAADIEEVLGDLDLASLCDTTRFAAAPVNAEPPRPKTKGKLLSLFPSGWMKRVTIAPLAALLAGLSLSVLAKIPRLRNSPLAMNFAMNKALTVPAVVGTSPGASVTRSVKGRPKGESFVDPDTTLKSQPNPTLPVVRDILSPAEFMVVHVEQQETLCQISIDNLGRYDAQVAAMIRELNPRLDDLDLIWAGQDIRIPTLESLLARTNLLAKHSVTTSAAEAKNHE
jgi:general secretion pathway protein A